MKTSILEKRYHFFSLHVYLFIDFVDIKWPNLYNIRIMFFTFYLKCVNLHRNSFVQVNGVYDS